MKNPQLCPHIQATVPGASLATNIRNRNTSRLKEYLTTVVMNIGSVDYCLRSSRLPYSRHCSSDYIAESIVSVHNAADTATLTKRIYEGIVLATDMVAFAHIHGTTLPYWIPFGRQQETVGTIDSPNTRYGNPLTATQKKLLLFRSICTIAIIYNKAKHLGKPNSEIVGFLSKGLFHLHNPYTSDTQTNIILNESIYHLHLAIKSLHDATEETEHNNIINISIAGAALLRPN